MSRGTDDFTVQELMNFIYDCEQDLRKDAEEKLPLIGRAYLQSLAGSPEWLKRELGAYETLVSGVSHLEKFRHEIEVKCGALFDKRNAKAKVGA